MTENTTLFELLGKTHFHWRIHHFNRGPAKVEDYLQSPRFRMSDANWFLQIFTNGETRKNSSGWIGLYLRKEESTAEYRIVYSLQIVKTDGFFLKNTCLFEATFKKEKSAMGVAKFIERSSLLSSKDALTWDGTLTVACTAKIIEKSVVSSFNEVEPHTSSPAITNAESASQTTCGSRSKREKKTKEED